VPPCNTVVLELSTAIQYAKCHFEPSNRVLHWVSQNRSDCENQPAAERVSEIIRCSIFIPESDCMRPKRTLLPIVNTRGNKWQCSIFVECHRVDWLTGCIIFEPLVTIARWPSALSASLLRKSRIHDIHSFNSTLKFEYMIARRDLYTHADRIVWDSKYRYQWSQLS
jgi:hypothetical protein